MARANGANPAVNGSMTLTPSRLPERLVGGSPISSASPKAAETLMARTRVGGGESGRRGEGDRGAGGWRPER